MTGSKKLFGDGKEIADALRERIKKETGLTISVGVSFTKTLAKLGSDLKKPDATTVLDRQHYMQIIGDLAPSELIMIGSRTAKKLVDLNIRTIYDLANADRESLRYHFGVIADNMINAAAGVETSEVKKYTDHTVPKSVSNGTTTPRDIKNIEEAKIVVYSLAELVAVRLRQYGLVAKGVYLAIKDPELNWKSRQRPLKAPSANAGDIAEGAIQLLGELARAHDPLRAITVGAIRLVSKEEIQPSLFDDDSSKTEKLDNSVDQIREKYGYHALTRGIVLDNDLTGNLHEDDDFRPFHQSKKT